VTKKILIKLHAEQATGKNVKQIFEESGYHDYTEAFNKYLHIDEDEVWQGNQNENRIKIKPLIIVGTPSMGKSTFGKDVMSTIENDYGHRGVCCVYTNEVSLGELMKHGLQTFKYIGDRWKGGLPKVYVLVFDDATAVEVTPDEIRRFFSIRHKAKEYSGINEGIIYTVFITHDWYSLNKVFRRYSLSAIFLSVSFMDKYSRDHLESLIGKKAVATLREISYKAMDYDEYKGYGFVKLPFLPEGESNDVGFIHFNRNQTEYVQVKYGINQTVEGNSVEMVLHIPKTRKTDEIKKTLESAKRAKEKNRERQQRFRQRNMQEA
jgi:hypothetical protein